MRPQRARRAAKRYEDTEDVGELDSDEFEALVMGDERPAKKKKRSTRAYAVLETAVVEAPADAVLDGAVEARVQAAPGADDGDYIMPGSSSSEGEEDGEDGAECEDAASPPAQPAPPAPQPADAASGKRKKTARMCVTYAKHTYGLSDKDIDQLTDVVFKDNPHYSSAPPMRLYLVHELKELARKKAEQKQQRLDTAAERKAAAAAAAAARKAQQAAAAAAKTQRFAGAKRLAREEQHGSVALPDTVLSTIMCCIAGGLQPDGLVGPSAVAKQLATVALTCWDFYHASKAGFEALGEAATAGGIRAPALARQWHHFNHRDTARESLFQRLTALHGLPGPPDLGGWAFWDRVVREPDSLRATELKAAAKFLHLAVTGTKAELMLRVLGAFGLQQPTSTAGAQLLRALALERSSLYAAWGGPNPCDVEANMHKTITTAKAAGFGTTHPAMCEALRAPMGRGVAGIRAAIAAAGYESIEQFQQAVQLKAAQDAAALLERRRQEAEEREARKAAAMQHRAQQAAAQAAEQGLPMPQGSAAPWLQPGQAPAHARVLSWMQWTASGAGVHRRECVCSRTAAVACTRGCCANCCLFIASAAPGAAPFCGRHNA